MRRFIIWIFVALCPLLSVAAEDMPCNFKLGAVVPLSGELAWIGTEARDGALLAQKEVNHDNINLDLVFEDSAHNLNQSSIAATKLIVQDHVKGILTLWDSTDVVVPIAERRGVLTIGIRWDPSITEHNPLTFTLESSYQSYIDSTLLLLNRLGKKRIACLYEQAAGWILGANYLKQVASEKGFEIVFSEALPSQQTDFRTLILKAVSKNPDVLLNLGNPPIPDLVIKQVKTIKPELFHTGYYSLIGDRSLFEGIPFVDQLGFYPKFEQRFNNAYGHFPKSRGAHVYEAVRLIGHSVELLCKRGEAVTAPAIAQELSKVRAFPSVLGPLTTGDRRNIEHPNYWKISINGAFVAYQ